MFSSIKRFFINNPSESLFKKTAKGSFWLLVFRIFDQSFGLIGTIILARLLAPSDFGLFGITLLAASFLDTFSQTGFQPALVHKKGDIRPYLDTSFIVQVIRGFLIALIIFVSAPYIAIFFKVEAAVPILRIMGFAIFIQGLENIATIYLQKELEFKKYFIYQISGTFAKFFISVILALIFRNVWALVIGFLAGTILRCLVSYVVYFYKPRLIFDFAKAKELFGYGKWIFGSNIISFFVTQIDSFFVQKLIGVAGLGFYQISYKIPSILNMEILTAAAFPAYSKIQDDISKLRGAYLKITKISFIILAPMAGGIFVIAADFITLFLGEKWLPSLWPMRIISLSVSMWMVAVVSNYMFLAIGRPNVTTRWTSIKLLILIIFLYPFIIKYNITGASIVVLVSSLVATFGLAFEAIRTIKCSLVQFINNVIFSFINALIMAVSVYFLKGYFPYGILGFLATVLAGILIYFFLTLLSDKIFNDKAFQLVKETVGLLK
ncbi:MAG: Membrane protein involved in the export of O-antigen and teichoic acid [Parcubacteria group bacterium GW2011_GWA1_33_6]|nr:MAG: Membrane protein involved in the export of O-antigen and teichoic acid [Parcubacteria group bacterium GW2011_GWA2_33_14]KKP55628.1 MAG: Membrane protein involved in the export of O-antigen and teichoic acid [Parcubacteria group bacterium GW2011_GWA1_33_6]